MSSLVRRIEKQIMKRAGYVRERYVIGKDAQGRPRLIPVRRGGVISDPAGESIGYHWPSRIPAAAAMPTNKIKHGLTIRDGKRVGRGRRRGKHSKRWIEARQARAA